MPNKIIVDRFPLGAVEIELSDADWRRFEEGEELDFGPAIQAALDAAQEG